MSISPPETKSHVYKAELFRDGRLKIAFVSLAFSTYLFKEFSIGRALRYRQRIDTIKNSRDDYKIYRVNGFFAHLKDHPKFQRYLVKSLLWNIVAYSTEC